MVLLEPSLSGVALLASGYTRFGVRPRRGQDGIPMWHMGTSSRVQPSPSRSHVLRGNALPDALCPVSHLSFEIGSTLIAPIDATQSVA